MKLIDFENHFYDQCLIDALEARTEPPYYRRDTDLITWSSSVIMPQGTLLQKLLDVGEGRLALMDELGIDTAVLSCSPGAEQLDVEESIRVCRATNDALYALTQRCPGRYLGSAILPVKDVDAALAELERCVKELGFVAWHTHSNYGETSPDDPRYWPLFCKAAERYLRTRYIPLLKRICPDYKKSNAEGARPLSEWKEQEFTLGTFENLFTRSSRGQAQALAKISEPLNPRYSEIWWNNAAKLCEQARQFRNDVCHDGPVTAQRCQANVGRLVGLNAERFDQWPLGILREEEAPALLERALNSKPEMGGIDPL